MNLERIISIVGSLENMCKAEGLITHKLRQCFESDMYQYQQSLIYASHLPSSMAPMMGGHPGAAGVGLSALSGGAYPAGVGHPGSHGQASMGAYSLGGASPSALSGRGSMITASSPGSSGATGAPGTHHIHSLPSPTAPPPAAFYGGYAPLPYSIYPSPGQTASMGAYGSLPGPSASAPYMGGMYIHPASNVDNVKETSTVYIPNSVVGAIIGRGGQTIRDMITSSGASIKVLIIILVTLLNLYCLSYRLHSRVKATTLRRLLPLRRPPPLHRTAEEASSGE